MSEEPVNNEDNHREPDGTLTSEALASLIIDELVRAKLIESEVFGRAVAIAAEEIEVRKALGDY